MGVVLTLPNPWSAATKRLTDLVPKLTPAHPGSVNTASAKSTVVSSVRRPISGISVKPDTPAYVQVIDAGGTVLNVFNELGSPDRTGPAAPDSKYWTDWSLQSVGESREEKIQITETFGETHFYAFGERPRFLQITAVLVNSADFNWRAQFWENWDRYFRATQLIKANAQLFISFDDVLVNGYAINASAQQVVGDPHRIIVNFSLFIVGYTNLNMATSNFTTTANGGGRVTLATTERIHTAGFAANRELDDQLQTRLSGVFATQTVRFNEYIKKNLSLGGIKLPGGATISGKDILFSSSLRYIRGSRSAAEVLLTHLNKEALTLAYQGVDNLAKTTPGGQAGLMFWYGLIGQMYESSFATTSAVASLLPFGTVSSKLLALSNNLTSLGNPYGVASAMAYATTAPLSLALLSATGRWEESNMRVDAYGNLTAKKGPLTDFGRSAGKGHTLALTSKALTSTSTTAGTATDIPSYSNDVGVTPQASTLYGAAQNTKASSADDEQAVLIAQKSAAKVRYGVISVVDSEADINEDGSEAA